MTLSPEWILGILIGILAAILGFAFKRIADLESKIDENRSLIGRVKDDYVRRDDMSQAINDVTDDLKELKMDVKESAGMLVQLLLQFGTKPRPPRGG